jgi:hypothetical protein
VLSRRAVAILATTSFLAGVGAAATDAHAADRRPSPVSICAKRANLVESPGASVVGVVHDGDVVRVLQRDRHDHWWRVLTRFRTRGWLKTSAICAEDR